MEGTKKKHEKNPSYVVIAKHDSGISVVKREVKAPNRKAAIAEATTDAGTFIVVPEKEWQQFIRRTVTVTQDTFL